MKLFIKPNDLLFFRDGRPYNMGEQSEGSGIFPPFPSTVYGAIRTDYIANNGGFESFMNGDMKDVIGTPNEKGSFRIRSLFVGNSEGPIYPIPRDLVTSSGDGYFKMEQVQLPIYSNVPQGVRFLWSKTSDKVKYSDGDCISHEDLIAYLQGEDRPFKPIKEGSYLIHEQKIGIGRDFKTRTSEEGKLYRINMFRLVNGYGLLVEIEGIDMKEQGMIKLGGEGKTAVYKLIADNNREPDTEFILKRIDESRCFKLYFGTHAIFENGWLPSGIDPMSFSWMVNGLKLRLITASLGKPALVGGWDMANKRPKPMRRAVPSGSVYYFELIEGNAEDVLRRFNGQNISDYLPEEGFGFCLVGVA